VRHFRLATDMPYLEVKVISLETDILESIAPHAVSHKTRPAVQ